MSLFEDAEMDRACVVVTTHGRYLNRMAGERPEGWPEVSDFDEGAADLATDIVAWARGRGADPEAAHAMACGAAIVRLLANDEGAVERVEEVEDRWANLDG